MKLLKNLIRPEYFSDLDHPFMFLNRAVVDFTKSNVCGIGIKIISGLSNNFCCTLGALVVFKE